MTIFFSYFKNISVYDDKNRSPFYIGVCWLDRRRIDGLTLGPWYRSQNLVWDTTVVDTLLWGHYKDSARHASFPATKGEAAKCKNTMTSKAITTFNQLQLRILVCIFFSVIHQGI